MSKKDIVAEVIIFVMIIVGVVALLAAGFIAVVRNGETTGGNYDGYEVIEVDIHGAKYTITDEERIMLAKLVYLEAGDCGHECQRAVVSVVLNRLESGYWGESVEEVIYFPNAFSPTDMMKGCIPIQESYEVVDYVLKNGPTIPKEVRYFRDDFDHRWDGYTHYATYDNIYFGFFVNGDH